MRHDNGLEKKECVICKDQLRVLHYVLASRRAASR